jgi:tetratricopeptide (TPR) repeat protein
LTGFVLLAAGGAWAQVTTVQGTVKDENGGPLKGAVVVLDRTDIKGHYQTKSDKKGNWIYTGLPKGTYDVTCTVDGKVIDKVNKFQTDYGDAKTLDFDLRKSKAQQAAIAQAAQSGQLTDDQQRGMSKEQKEQFEAAAKQRSEQMKKNKALNDAYNLGQDASKKAQADTDKAQKATDYQVAIDNFNKAGQLDPGQVAIWNSLGDAYYGLGNAQAGDERNKSYDQAIASYQKSLQIKPDDAAIYNQMGNIYGAEKKIPEAKEALTKAAQLDPQMAGKAYFNMGANLVNTGHTEDAAEFFKKATDAEPNNAEAWYQLGSLLMMKGTVDAKTGAQTYPPETADALKKYLELKPDGSHAQEATAMLQAMGQTVQTKTTVPSAKTKKK